MFSQEPGSSRSSNSSIASGATAAGRGLITNGKKELGHLKGRIDYVRGTNLRGHLRPLRSKWGGPQISVNS